MRVPARRRTAKPGAHDPDRESPPGDGVPCRARGLEPLERGAASGESVTAAPVDLDLRQLPQAVHQAGFRAPVDEEAPSAADEGHCPRQGPGCWARPWRRDTLL